MKDLKMYLKTDKYHKQTSQHLTEAEVKRVLQEKHAEWKKKKIY
jgi:hypothetical protein